MIRELMTIFRGDDEPLARMAEDFRVMLSLALDSTFTAGEALFDRTTTSADRSAVYDKDIEINKLQRTIRKQVVAHLSIKGNQLNVPYCLLLMSLVKDVERLGDYAKNLVEIEDIHPGRLPDDENTQELLQLRKEVERAFASAADVLEQRDREEALSHITAGRDIAHRCDSLLIRAAQTDNSPAATAAIVLATRYYKRIGGHLLNLMSSVVMPLHKLDYYDEASLRPDERDGQRPE